MGFVPLAVEFSQFDLEAAMRRRLLQNADWFNGSNPEPPHRSTKEQRVDDQIRVKLEEALSLAQGSRSHTAMYTRLRIEGQWHNHVHLCNFGYLYGGKPHHCIGRFALFSSHEKGRNKTEPNETAYYLFLSDWYPQDPANPWRPAGVDEGSGKMLVWRQGSRDGYPGGGNLENGIKLMLPGVSSVTFKG